MKLDVIAYTDGSGPGAYVEKGEKLIGVGGWAAVVLVAGFPERTVIYGADPHTTISRMEISALIGVLDRMIAIGAQGSTITVHTDSAYLMNAHVENWISRWQNNGWLNSRGCDVANRDLWERLIELGKHFIVKWVKVKGHSMDEYNDLADKWARYARDSQPTMPVVTEIERIIT